MKELVGDYIAARIQDGTILGIGSGTTAEAALLKIGERISREGMTIRGVATSFKQESLARSFGIVVEPLSSGLIPDFAFDGADEVDSELRLIKGRGAAITREKVVARRAGGLTVIVTEEKLVSWLGERFPVPIEVIPDATPDVLNELSKYKVRSAALREGSGKFGPVVTEHGNFLIDVTFSEAVPADFDEAMRSIPGVLETGVFSGYSREVIVAKDGKLYRFERGGALKPL